MKVYVVGGNIEYVNFIKDVELVGNVKDADLVVFTGGEDVTPSFYGCEAHPSTYNNPDRDKYEKEIFDQIDPVKQVCYGSCRGSQFLCVMNGGLLVQNVNRHAIGSTHAITDGKKMFQITSTHHQMQYPFNLKRRSDYDILYTAAGIHSNIYEGDKIDENVVWGNDPEIVLYHVKNKPKCLAVQGHPEMIPESPVAEMINDLIQNLVNERN
jgi:gamma-glutamyl-gamma-aminobutyrate hydrolase PuuD